jgi:hypothetical protein
MKRAGIWVRITSQPLGKVLIKAAATLAYIPIPAWIVIEAGNFGAMRQSLWPILGIDYGYLGYSMIFGPNLNQLGCLFLVIWTLVFFFLILLRGKVLLKVGASLKVKWSHALILTGICLGWLQLSISHTPWPLIYFFVYAPGIILLGYSLDTLLYRTHSSQLNP